MSFGDKAVITRNSEPRTLNSERVLLIILLVSIPLLGQDSLQISQRPVHWAQPMTLAGVPNFYKITDQLYRSAQPTADGMKNLERMGIKTIVNLRSIHSDREKLKGTKLNSERISMSGWYPNDREIIRFLKIVTDSTRTPVLVHCQHGADRTGLLCASYRIILQGWSKEKALEEMKEGGFGFHRYFKNLEYWILTMNVKHMKKKVSAQ